MSQQLEEIDQVPISPIDLEEKKIAAVGKEIVEASKQPFMFLTGKAGSGKTTAIKRLAELDKNYIELGGTAGIAAINLGTKTINSILKYFNTKSLEEKYQEGLLHMQLRLIRSRGKRVIGIEEGSMMPAKQLDLIYDAISEINNDSIGRSGKLLGLHFIGDFAQLPPVNEKFAFTANCWEEFDKNTVKLEKIWRQDNPDFIEAINFVRAGDGKNAVPLLKKCGVNFVNSLDDDFDGTTIITKNDEVDVYNNKRLTRLNQNIIRVSPTRRGRQLSEWEKFIPYEMRFCKGAYVMILNNDSKDWTYVNGDCGWIENFDAADGGVFKIKLKRNGNSVYIRQIRRFNMQETEPMAKDFNSMFRPSVDFMSGDWIIGYIDYFPLRLAYAATCHKSQGLSLDKVQVDSRNSFFGYPNMSYVAISRCKTPENLYIVGKEEGLIKKINCAPEVKKWI